MNHNCHTVHTQTYILAFIPYLYMNQITSWRSPKTHIRESKKGGKGLFAKKDINKEEVVFIKSGHILDGKQTKNFAEELGDYYLQIHDDFYISPTTKDEVLSTAIFINHSCEPNVGPDGQITFIALRDIKAGEELCYDYAMTTAHPYELKCHCGSKRCRKTITGNDWKLKELQEKYGNHFIWFILKKIKAMK